MKLLKGLNSTFVLIELIYLLSSIKTLNFLDDTLDFQIEGYKSSEGTQIRCFWLEAKNYTVYDLKNLQRPLKQKE